MFIYPDKIPPFLLQHKQSQLSASPHFSLQPYYCPPGLLLGPLQYVHVSLILGRSALDTLSSAERKNHLPPPPSNTLPDAVPEAFSFWGHKGTLLAHDWLGIHQDPQGFFWQGAFQPLDLQPVLVPTVIFPPGRRLHISPCWINEVPVKPFFSTVKSLAEVKIHCVHCSPLIHWASFLIWLLLITFLFTFGNGFQDYLLHHLRDPYETDCLVAPLVLLENRKDICFVVVFLFVFLVFSFCVCAWVLFSPQESCPLLSPIR